MDKSLFIKDDTRKTLKLRKKDGKLVNFKIYNYTDNSKQQVFNIYKKKMDRNMESFDLAIEELQVMFDMFTDYRFTIDELDEILENPSVAFEQIFHEIEMILGDITILFLQEQEKKLLDVKIKDAITDLEIAMVDSVEDIKDISGE